MSSLSPRGSSSVTHVGGGRLLCADLGQGSQPEPHPRRSRAPSLPTQASAGSPVQPQGLTRLRSQTSFAITVLESSRLQIE